jgi:hypothetical protein
MKLEAPNEDVIGSCVELGEDVEKPTPTFLK